MRDLRPHEETNFESLTSPCFQVAVVFEAARLLSDKTFPCTILFIAVKHIIMLFTITVMVKLKSTQNVVSHLGLRYS